MIISSTEDNLRFCCTPNAIAIVIQDTSTVHIHLTSGALAKLQFANSKDAVAWYNRQVLHLASVPATHPVNFKFFEPGDEAPLVQKDTR